MLQERELLEKKVKTKIDNIFFSSEAEEKARDFCENMKTAFDYPESLSMDILFRTPDLSILNENVLFYTTHCLGINTSKWFTEVEIQYYSKPYKQKGIKFPLRLKAVKIAEDQWVVAGGSIFLSELSNQQLIVYNTNTQRVMKKRIRNGEVGYKIELNRNAVKEIIALMESGDFIPNAITLNISDPDAEFYYDEVDGTLILKSVKNFDIIDGYHRLVAINKLTKRNPDFYYPMEIRIVAFSEEKAKQFIYQEDQKTKMRKIDSSAMNQSSDENFIATRLNESAGFNFKGCITLSGQINYAEFSAAISRIYYTGYNVKDKKYRMEVLKELKEGLNYISDEYTELLDYKNFKWQQVLVLGELIKTGKYKDPERLQKVMDNFEELPQIIKGDVRNKKTYARVQEFLKE